MNHQDIDRRSLMMHRMIAARLRSQPELMAVAHANMARWNCPERGWWQEWSAILSSQTVEEVACLIERDDEDACRMRQSAPFAGILTPKEVWELKRNFKRELEARTAPDRRAVTDGSRGFQPTERQSGKDVSQSDTVVAFVAFNPADGFLSRVPVSRCDTNRLAGFPWAEAHGYRPSPLCGENVPRNTLRPDENTAAGPAFAALLS